ncbi:MAG TPA: glycosyltransferase family 9 protein [bacterium]|nr:glycosyltransferase family 9 protein [bacterium]
MKDYRNIFVKIAITIFDAIGWLLFFWLPKPQVDPTKVKSLLILKFDRLGDTFLAEPTIKALRQLFPKAELTVACSPWNQAVLANNPAIDRLLPIFSMPDVQKNGWLDFFSRPQRKYLAYFIKTQEVDLAIDLQGNPLNVLAMFLSGVRRRIGFGPKIFSFLLTGRAYYRYNQPQSEIYFSLAKLLGYTGELEQPQIYANPVEQNQAVSFIRDNSLNNFIVFHVGAGRSYRQWPIDNFAELAQRLLAQYTSHQIVVIGGLDDDLLFDRLASQIKAGDRLVNAADRLSIPATYELIRRARLFVGNESGPGHLAAALGVPTVSLMNPWSGVNRWQARGPKVSYFYQQAHFCRGVGCHHKPCPNMAAITVDEVYQKASSLL